MNSQRWQRLIDNQQNEAAGMGFFSLSVRSLELGKEKL